jgi:hypothetical protein
LGFVAFNTFKFAEFILEEMGFLEGQPIKLIAGDGKVVRIDNPEIYLYSI